MEKIERNPTFARNQHGIKVIVCCASCAFKVFKSNGMRLCSLHQYQVVQSCHGCSDWAMSDGMRNAGLGTGRVRHRGSKELILR